MREWRIRFGLPANAMANGTNPLGLLDEMRDLGECRIVVDTSKVPVLAALEPRDIHLRWDVTLKTERPRADIEDVFIFVMDDMELDITEVATERPAAATKPAEAPVAKAVVVTEREAPAVQAANDSRQANGWTK